MELCYEFIILFAKGEEATDLRKETADSECGLSCWGLINQISPFCLGSDFLKWSWPPKRFLLLVLIIPSQGKLSDSM